MREFVQLLEAWFAAEGSLHIVAQSLFIHKNTIQYRLKRIAEITGLDVRRPSQAPALYLATQFFMELEAERTSSNL
jgi:carbohydrate diacid regulator